MPSAVPTLVIASPEMAAALSQQAEGLARGRGRLGPARTRMQQSNSAQRVTVLDNPSDAEKIPRSSLPAKERRKSLKTRWLQQSAPSRTQELEPSDAIATMTRLSDRGFVETAEAHAALGINPRYNDQQIRATVVLPKGTGTETRVAVICTSGKEDELKEAGADYAGSEDLIEEISKGLLDFDKVVATPDMMPSVAKLGKVLGPRGMMPNPKAGTVANDPVSALNEFKAGKMEYRNDREGSVHMPFGKLNFEHDDLLTNLKAVQKSIDLNRPSGTRGNYWVNMFISSSMGPGIQVNVRALRNMAPTT